MDQMNRIATVWGIFLVLIFAGITVFGFAYTKVRKEYERLENILTEAAKEYIEENFMFSEVEEGTKLSYQNLKEETEIAELKIKNTVCDGYVLVYKNDLNFIYEGFIKCPKYKTKGYK